MPASQQLSGRIMATPPFRVLTCMRPFTLLALCTLVDTHLATATEHAQGANSQTVVGVTKVDDVTRLGGQDAVGHLWLDVVADTRQRTITGVQRVLDELAELHNTSFSVGLASPKLGGYAPHPPLWARALNILGMAGHAVGRPGSGHAVSELDPHVPRRHSACARSVGGRCGRRQPSMHTTNCLNA
jgi:hypothetical protein